MAGKKTKPEEKVKKADLFKVPFANLRIVDGLNIRHDYGDIKELAASIEANGLKVALQGYRDGEEFYIVDGHRRYKALEMLHKRGVNVIAPFTTEAKGTNEEQRVVNMVITNDGKALNPLELAEAVRRLLAYGWSEKEIATSIGKTSAYVGKLNKLNEVPKKFANLVIAGEISPTLAIQLAGDGKIEEFMQRYESGEFQGNKESDSGKTAKITAKQIASPNSWKYFKNFALTADKERMNAAQRSAFDFMVKVNENEVDIAEYHKFFNQE